MRGSESGRTEPKAKSSIAESEKNVRQDRTDRAECQADRKEIAAGESKAGENAACECAEREQRLTPESVRSAVCKSTLPNTARRNTLLPTIKCFDEKVFRSTFREIFS
jgi:hypothetical protein